MTNPATWSLPVPRALRIVIERCSHVDDERGVPRTRRGVEHVHSSRSAADEPEHGARK